MSTEETRGVVAGYVAAPQRGDIGALRASFTPKATEYRDTSSMKRVLFGQ